MAYQDVPEEQRLSYALDGDTLKIDFCRSGHLLSSSPEKQLVLSIPRSLTLEKFEADTTAAAVNVTGLHTQTVDISTVSGGASTSRQRRMRSTFPPLVAARRWTRIFISSISPPSAAA